MSQHRPGDPSSPGGSRPGSILFTDLYELTMAAGYQHEGLAGAATFDLFVRSLPPSRSFLVAAGLSEALGHLESLSITEAELSYLGSTGHFDDELLSLLRGLRFTGDVWAVAEGEVVFAEEPLLRVTAPLIEAQVVETRLLNIVASQTMIASKAARIAIACGDRRFVDFSARRDHGGDAALQAARASWIGGASGTSLVEAGYRYGLPLSGTMAHSFVMSFESELDAFRAFARCFPTDAVLLIDTYDTEEGARNAVRVAAELADEGVRISAVRLDSGDIVRLSKAVRRILDEGGLEDAGIFASGDLDEYRIAEVLGSRAPIDAFGVGTQLGTSGDAPSLGAVYKLVEDPAGPKIKLSEEKVTLPGRKQVWRISSGGDRDESLYDVIALEGEEVQHPQGTSRRALLEPVMSGGLRCGNTPSLDEARRRREEAVASLPSRLRSLLQRERPYEVRRSPGLAGLVEELSSQHRVEPGSTARRSPPRWPGA